MKALIETARAKINLALHVVGQRDDGYHYIDSLVTFFDYGDILTFSQSNRFVFEIDGPFQADLDGVDQNLAVKAAQLFGTPPVSIRLTKNLPISSGIGGGSADAAAVLRGLSKLMGRNIPSLYDQLNLGADVPVCVHQMPVRMAGIGEALEPIKYGDQIPAVLINPGHAVSTKTVFEKLSKKNNPGISDVKDIDVNTIRNLRNDLQPIAISICPSIKDALNQLTWHGAVLARMSGSGATSFGIFSSINDAQSAAGKISQEFPTWWVKSGLLN